MMKVQSNSWVEVSSSALLNNIKTVRSQLQKGTKFFAVVKANAYGHDIGLISKAAEPFVDGFCVASSEEALLLRRVHRIKKRILIVSYFTTLKKSHLKLLAKLNIEIPLISKEQIIKVLKTNIPLVAHLKVDTGTSRIGILPDEVNKILKHVRSSKRLTIRGVYSHFAEAEKKDSQFTKKQLSIFNSVVNDAEKTLGGKIEKHIACSAAVLTSQKSHFNAVRVGIHLYGLSGLGRVKQLHPVLAWKTNILQLKTVKKGTTIGYNRTFKARKKTIIGVIPVGYWDGYDRRLSNNGFITVQNKKCPIRGIVCMNLTMFDASRLINPHVGDVVSLIGNSSKNDPTANVLARACKTINYEIITRINAQIPRMLV